MGHPNRLDTAVQAFRQARSLAHSASYVEDDAFHRALDEARYHGLGVRETAKLLDVPRSTISRWLTRQTATGPGPSIADHPWVTEEDTVLASNRAWRHDEAEQISQAPFSIEIDQSGRRIARLRPVIASAKESVTESAGPNRPRSCRFGRHHWDQRSNPENGADYEVCLRCNAYRDDGSPAAEGTAAAAAVQANIGGFGGGF